MDLPTFRASFPEFGPDAYPDAQANFYFSLAGVRLDPLVWGALLDYGSALYVAHCLALAKQRGLSAAAGQPPGFGVGVLTSKAVKDVSAGYDATVATIEGAGNYNLTTYGTQFYELMMIVGAGAIQLGATFLPGDPAFWAGYGGGAGWLGP